MTLSEIATCPDRDRQLAELVVHSRRTSASEKQWAQKYLDTWLEVSPLRIRQIARKHGLDAIKLSDYLPQESICDLRQLKLLSTAMRKF